MEHHFFAYISRMKFIQRWGLMRNTIPENDMEHALQTAMFAHAIAIIGVERYHKVYNPEHIMALALYYGGENGYEEKNAVLNHLKTIDDRSFTVLCCEWSNRRGEPPMPILIWKEH